MHVSIGFKKLGQIKCKALWVVDSVNFSTKRERGENAVLAILLKLHHEYPEFFLTVHYLQSTNISRLCSTAVRSVLGSSRPRTVRGFGFLSGC